MRRVLAALTVMMAVSAYNSAHPLPAEAPWALSVAGEWRFSVGDNSEWAQRDFDDSDWELVRAPGLWDSYGHADYDGFGWYRRWFTAPASMIARLAVVEIGGVDDDDWVYLNGQPVGQGKGCYKPRRYNVPAGVLRPGRNLIAVRIYDGAMGGGLAVGPLMVRESVLTDRITLSDCKLEAIGFGRAELRLRLEFANQTDDRQEAAVRVELLDYLQRRLADEKLPLVLEPKGHFERALTIRGTECTDYRLRLTLSQGNDRNEFLRYLQAPLLLPPHVVVPLSGEWQFIPVAQLEYAPKGEWRTLQVPTENWGGWPGKEHHAWFRRSVEVPAGLQEQRIRLHFEAVAHRAEVYVDGERVGDHLGGFEPFDVDITDRVRPGETAELVVGVNDWVAGLKPGQPAPEDPEKLPARSMLLAYGTRPHAVRGIWQDVCLIAHGKVAVERSFVQTSVRGKSLHVKAWLRNFANNTATAQASASVCDAGTNVFDLPQQTVTLAAGQSRLVEWTRPWQNPRLWWPDDPHLYYVRTSVTVAGQPSDRHDTRFGFREFWIDGKDYRLNGRLFRLRGLLCAPGPIGPERVRDYYLQDMREANFSLVRFHMYPRPKYFYDIADEVGMPIKSESAFYCAATQYDLANDRLWDNLRQHIEGMVHCAWNHPSLFIWSAENEILHCGGIGTPGADQRIFELGQRIAELDPTRPVEFEGDGDVVGRAATANIHYPREFGCHNHNLWPNDGWWLGNEGNDRWPGDLVWKGDKPLIIGEFVHYPYSRPPGGVAIFTGDRAYLSREEEQAAHVMGVRFLCEGARWAGVAGINPWVGEEVYGQKCLAPITVILREWDHHFWTGEQVQRHLLVLNDTLRAERLRLSVAVMERERRRWRWSEECQMEPGARWPVTLTVQMPTTPGEYHLVAKVTRGTGTVYLEERDVRVVDRKPVVLPAGLRVALFSPGEARATGLAQTGLRLPGLKALDALRDLDLVIIGREVWAQSDGAGREVLPEFVRAGGKVIVLPQSRLPEWLPVRVAVDTKMPATMTYPRYPGHPVLEGVERSGATDITADRGDTEQHVPRALCWWRGDHFVSRAMVRKPQRGEFRLLAEGGGRGGLLWTPLLELPDGRGWWLLCQFDVDEKPEEPMARQLLQNALRYAAQYQPPRPTAFRVLSKDTRFNEFLRSVGVGASAFVAAVPYPVATQVLIVRASADSAALADPLRRFANEGGTLWLHCSDRSGEGLLQQLVPGLKGLRTVQGGSVVKLRDDGLVAGLSNSDFFWFREDCRFGDWEGRGTGLLDTPAEVRLDLVSKAATSYLRPLTLCDVSFGKGRLIVSTLRFAEASPTVADKARRIASTLLTNLGLSASEKATSTQAYRHSPVDLHRHFTAGLKDEVAGDRKGGWTDQGSNDLRALRTGRQILGGVDFDIADGCIALRSPTHLPHAPARVERIPVGRTCEVLFFLHAAAWASSEPKEIARCRVCYADGQEQAISMTPGANIGDWWNPSPLPLAEVAWRGRNPVHDSVGLYLYTWLNPRPDERIDTLAFESAEGDAVYLLVGVTIGTHQ